MKKNNKKYALKEMSKVKIIDRRSEKSIKGEREFLSKLHHPFIVNMTCAFQDYENLYLVMDLLTGGDLRYHLCRNQKFTEEETKFFIACLLLGLEYIHGNNIIHRDIKPENLVCDDRGYIRITDFGVAKVKKEDNSSETSGTPGYMAPEVLLAQNHSFPVDFFAIGIMGYEFMFGERPYIGRSRKEIKHLVLRKQARIDDEDIPMGWSYESVDFINKCLKRKYNRRLGYNNGVIDLKEHEWFSNYNWEKLFNKKLNAPFIPKKGGNYDRKYCEAIEKLSDTTFERYQSYMNQKNFEKIFEGYTFINYELIQNNFGIETNTRMTTNTKQSKLQSTSNLTNNNNNNDKKKTNQNIIINNEKNNDNNNLKNKNKEENSLSNSPKERQNNKLSNNIILDKDIEKEKEKEKIEEKNDKLKIKEEGSSNINLNNSPHYKYQKKFKIDKKDLNQTKNIENEENNNINSNRENNDINNLASNNSIYNKINNNLNNIKKITTKSDQNKVLRSTSVDITTAYLKNNLSNKDYNKQKNKELNMNYINNNFINNIENNKYLNGSLSNPNREKINYKLKNNTGLSTSMMIKKNNNTKREISHLYNSNSNFINNHLYKRNNKFIQFRQINHDNQNEFPLYLPNLNKNSSFLNIQGLKKKAKINLNQLKLKINNNLKLRNDFINNNKNKFLLSPNNRRLKKSESTPFIKNTLNSSNNNLNNNFNIHKRNNKYINNMINTHLHRNLSNFSKEIKKNNFKNENLTIKKKKIKDSNEFY